MKEDIKEIKRIIFGLKGHKSIDKFFLSYYKDIKKFVINSCNAIDHYRLIYEYIYSYIEIDKKNTPNEDRAKELIEMLLNDNFEQKFSLKDITNDSILDILNKYSCIFKYLMIPQKYTLTLSEYIEIYILYQIKAWFLEVMVAFCNAILTYSYRPDM